MQGMKQGGSHPTRAELEGFMRGELRRPQARGVVRHLLTGCPECLAVTRHCWALGVLPPEFYREILELVAPASRRSLLEEPGLL